MDDLTLWDVAKWLVIVLGIGAFVAGYVRESLRQWLPTPRRVVRWMKARDLVPAPGTHLTVLIADLEGDTDGSQTRHVRAALDLEPGFHVRMAGQTLSVADIGDQTEARSQAERRGREWLRKHNADILVWGEVAQTNTRLRLRFLPLEERAVVALSGGEGGQRSGSYRLNAAELPVDFNQDLNAAVVAQAVASIAPAISHPASRHFFQGLRRSATEKLRRLCQNLPTELDAVQRGSLRHALGLAASTLGEHCGERHLFEEAIESYSAALEDYRQERAPLEWAATQNNLGNALLKLGEREPGPARLREAVQAYQAALREYTRERAPLEWAGAQNNLGTAFLALGQREPEKTGLEEAVAAFEAALEEYTRERLPLLWAATQNNLGAAFLSLGERE